MANSKNFNIEFDSDLTDGQWVEVNEFLLDVLQHDLEIDSNAQIMSVTCD